MNMITRPLMSFPSSQRGVTLIEMMVAMVISLVVSGVAATVFVSARQSARYAEGLSRYQETLRFAQAAIVEDLRSAGQLGCRTDLTTTTGLKENDGVTYGKAVDGVNSWTSSSTLGTVASTEVKAGSDAIRLQFASRDGNSLSANMATANDSISVTDGAAYSSSDPLIISDCSNADTFKPSADAASGTAITHAALSRAYGKSVAQVYHFLDRAYFIDTANQLVQATGATHSPIASGIEALRFEYGVDTDADGFPNRYVNATDVGTAWGNVVAVRACMLVVSQDTGLAAVVNSSGLSSYIDCTGASQTDSDHRLRFPVNFTVRIRNRGAASGGAL